MHSLEMIHHRNDTAALKGARVKFHASQGQLRNCLSGEIASARTFANSVQAAQYAAKYGAEYAGLSRDER